MFLKKYHVADYGSEIEKIGIISDSHIPTRGRFLPPRVFDIFDGVDLILHAGDLVDPKVLDELLALAPVEAVAGNMDPHHLRRQLGRFKLIRAGGAAVGLLHGDLSGHRFNFEQALAVFAPDQPGAIVFGHLHRPVVEYFEGTLFLNPGSVIDPRSAPEPSVGMLTIEAGRVSGEIIYL